VADCYISEHMSAASAIGTANPPVLPQPALAVQKIAIGATTQSNAFSDKTRAIMIVADGPCHFSIGESPTASTSTMLLPSGVPMVFGVPPGYKIAVST